MPRGRILLKSISQSKKLSLLKTDGARLLYTWLIPHLDVNGCFSGDPAVIRGQVMTRLGKSLDDIKRYLADILEIGLIILYEANGDIFLQVPDFLEKQPTIKRDREGRPFIPLPTNSGLTPDELKTNSGLTLHKLNKGKVKLNKTICPSFGCVFCIFDFYCKTMNRDSNQYKPTQAKKSKIKARLKDSTVIEIYNAILACKASSHHQGQNDRDEKFNDLLKNIIPNREKVEWWGDRKPSNEFEIPPEGFEI